MTTVRYCKTCGRELWYSLVGDFDTQHCTEFYNVFHSLKESNSKQEIKVERLTSENKKFFNEGVDYRRSFKALRADREILIQTLQKNKIMLPKLSDLV